MTLTTPLRVNQERLWASLMELAQIGGTPRGGCKRLALTDEDKEGRDLFIKWAQEAGCTVTIDPVGNIFARRPGTDDSLAPVATGSHLDTQPTGGKFDGPLGVMCGLEVLRVLHEHGLQTKRPIEVVSWTNEEGARFAPPMVGSGVFAGVFDLDYGLSLEDADGATFGDELRRIGYDGDGPLSHDLHAFVEVHIEQGPILEAEGRTIGLVSGAQARRWYEVSLTGQDAHAGTTPMDRRRDALVGAAQFITEINRIGNSVPDGRSTVGAMRVSPGSRNTIPGHVFFTVDLRHPDNAVLANMAADFREYAAGAAREHGLELDLREIVYSPAEPFDANIRAAVARSAAAAGYDTMDVVSGAGHDACYLARVAPSAMIFIPCTGGLSHNELEEATKEDAAAGCDVLLRTLLELADG